jgi:hypothetical protein
MDHKPVATVKVGGITLHRNGKPLTAGDIPEDAEITFDRTTGEVAVTPETEQNARERVIQQG